MTGNYGEMGLRGGYPIKIDQKKKPKQITLCVIMASLVDNIFQCFLNLKEQKTVTVWILRFVPNCKQLTKKIGSSDADKFSRRLSTAKHI